MRISKLFHVEKKSRNANGRFEVTPYQPDSQYAVIRCSICTGEKVAGFKSKKDGHFTEVMLIRSSGDVEEFKRLYQVDEIKTEY